MGRTNIAIDDAVADELSFEAGRENKTQYALANEALMAVLEVTKAGGDPKQIYPSWKFVSMMKDVSCLVLPQDLVEKLISSAYTTDRKWLLRAWYDEGSRLGEFLKMSALNPDQLGDVIREFQVLLPAQKIEFKEITEKQESPVDLESPRVRAYEIKATGAGNSQEATECAEQLILGLLSSYSLTITETRKSRGIIDIKAMEKSSRPSPSA